MHDAAQRAPQEAAGCVHQQGRQRVPLHVRQLERLEVEVGLPLLVKTGLNDRWVALTQERE